MEFDFVELFKWLIYVIVVVLFGFQLYKLIMNKIIKKIGAEKDEDEDF